VELQWRRGRRDAVPAPHPGARPRNGPDVRAAFTARGDLAQVVHRPGILVDGYPPGPSRGGGVKAATGQA
jgi:hypothetical protein